MKKLSFKGVLSTILILEVVFLACTGALLFFGKTGLVWGMPRYTLRTVHFWVAVSMCVLAALHLVLNFRAYRAELRTLKNKKRPDSEKE